MEIVGYMELPVLKYIRSFDAEGVLLPSASRTVSLFLSFSLEIGYLVLSAAGLQFDRQHILAFLALETERYRSYIVPVITYHELFIGNATSKGNRRRVGVPDTSLIAPRFAHFLSLSFLYLDIIMGIDEAQRLRNDAKRLDGPVHNDDDDCAPRAAREV